jgi:uroporphyrinogen-III synthase
VSNAIVFPDTESALQACGVGSVFERVAHGWKVKFVDGGTSVFVEGPTITEALASHGAQVVHPVKVVPEGIVEVEPEPVLDVSDDEDGG